AIDSVKDQNINDYLNLRDRLRLELVALKLMGEPSTSGMQVNDIFITPGCYQRYISQWQVPIVNKIDSSQKLLSSLYTPWGLAVAACLEGDSPRAIQLKPAHQATAGVEIFAQKFVAYHEGCHYLQQQNWRGAIIPLQQAQSEINIIADWEKEIDKLCGLQRQNISNFSEHLDFAQFWYEILGSQSARSYLAEYKAEQIREQVSEEQISLDKALIQLQELQKIDPQNPIVLDLISRVKFQQELKSIEKLIRSNKFEVAVQRAKISNHQRIRTIVAEICIDILLKAIENRDLEFEDIYQLGSWAYSLCPDEPGYQEIYHSLKLY
ncbi:peptidase M, neutral zinc metallopeptidase site, partial [Nodularia sphaerocarpa CS-585A2]|nr:peptidase M, neutral zinc metallopeptidase site [Nodularia sphaerocarpa CS-585A2]